VDVLEKILREPLKIPRHLGQLFAIWKQIANGAHSSVRGLLQYSLHTAVGNGDVNKIGSCFQ
jgi:hypothetical protein